MRQRRSIFGSSIRRTRRAQDARPRLEALEGRVLLASAVFNVTNTNDSGAGSLRQAIIDANDNLGTDTIFFNFSDSQTNHTISLTSDPLPAVNDQISFGYSTGTPTTPVVVIDGSQLSDSTANGLTFQPGMNGTTPTTPDNSTVRGLVIQHFGGAGIYINGANSISIFGNYVGTSGDGTTAASNGTGILINNSASNKIGGSSSGLGNVISGNVGDGISIQGVTSIENIIQNNVIGLNAAADSAVSNGANGIRVGGSGGNGGAASQTTIGGSIAASRNTISGNTGAGVLITDGSQSNLVQFNRIGTNGTGTAAIANNVGVSLTGGATGNTIGGSNSTTSGTSLTGGNLLSGNIHAGVTIDNAQKNLLIGNFIGTNEAGNAAMPGAPTTEGVILTNNASGNTIGTALASQANLISGLADAGVMIQGGSVTGSVTAGNVVQGNYLGTNAAGTAAIPNVNGVAITGAAASNTIGGTSSGTRNVISGNSGAGVLLTTAATRNAIQGNLIGLQLNGSSALANGGSGVKIDGASNNAVGGTLSAAANVIAFNQGDGVVVLSGINNAIRQNSIFGNTALGIDLGGDGVTPNHIPPLQSGPNLSLNYPVLDTALAGSSSTQASGTYNGIPFNTYTIEFYSIDQPDPSGYGQGRTYLGATTVSTGSDGTGSFTTTLGSTVPTTSKLTALAIDPNGNTSEFALDAQVKNPQADVAVSMTASAPGANQANAAATSGFIIYTITVTNNGPDPATGVTLTDTLPTGVSLLATDAPYNTVTQSSSILTITVGTLDNGASMTYHVTVVAPSSVPATNPLANKVEAKVGPTVTDPNPSNNTAIATTTVQAGVNLAVTSSFMPSAPVLGQETVIYVTITNQTSTAATNVVMTDTLPSNFVVDSITTTQGTVNPTQNGRFTVNLGTLPSADLSTGSTIPSGASARVAIYGRPTASYQFLTNIATASSSEPEIQVSNNTSVTTAVAVPSISALGAASASTSAPRVVKVARTGVHRQATRYDLAFNEAMDAVSTQNLANYQLVTAGRDRRFGTHDDRALPFRSAVYNASTNAIALSTVRPVGLKQRVQLTVNGSTTGGVSSASGVLLDGAGTGSPGSNYVTQIVGYGPVAPVSAHGVDALLSGKASRRKP